MSWIAVGTTAVGVAGSALSSKKGGGGAGAAPVPAQPMTTGDMTVTYGTESSPWVVPAVIAGGVVALLGVIFVLKKGKN